MHVGTSLSAVLLSVFACANAFPTSESSRVPENAGDKSVGRLAFTLADPNTGKAADAPPAGGSFLDLIQALTKSFFFQKFVQYIGGVAAPQQNDEPKKVFGTRQHVPQADLPEAARNFEASLSLDDASESVPSGAAIAPLNASPKSIMDEGFSHLLFGEKGVLTNVFHMMDARRQNEQASMAEQARRAQADPGNAKIKEMDFAKVFDTLLMGGQRKNEFGEPGPELPEFLGICNRLSCGDIYKAIDEFRRSEFFSNFQTAMQLMQDPKGWEIIGKMLSNPELISQFTGGDLLGGAAGGAAGGGIGAGLGGMLGSALGGAKAAVAKEGGDTLTTKDGDFGTDFSGVAKIDKEQYFKALPETSFSIDEGEKGEGAGGDYYSEIVSNIDEDFEVEDKDILGLPTKSTTLKTTTTGITQSPSISRTVSTTSATAPTTSSVASTTIRPTTLAAATAPVPMLLPKKGAQIPMPEIEFNIDEEDYGTTVEEIIDSMPPAVVIDEKIPSNATVKPVEMLVVGQNFMETSKIMPSSTTTTKMTNTPATTTTTTTTTPKPRPIAPIRPIVPMAKPVPRPVPVVTSAPLVIAPSSSSRPVQMRRISIGGTIRATVPPRNHRKDSDYYAMYYDN